MKKHILQQYVALTGVQAAVEDAMKALAKARPTDPLVFVGNFLLENSHKYENNFNVSKEDRALHEDFINQEEQVQYDEENRIRAEQEAAMKKKRLLEEVDDQDEYKDKVELNMAKPQSTRRASRAGLGAPGANADDETTITAKPNIFINAKNTLMYTQFPEIQHHQKLSNKAQSFHNPQVVEQTQLIYYKGKNLFLQKIYDEFKTQFKGHTDLIYQRAALGQTIKINNEKTTELVGANEESLLVYLNEKSQLITAHNAREIARGNEGVVYKIEHSDVQELVAKCTLLEDDFTDPNHHQDQFKDILQESLTLKMLANENYIAEIKEEIIEYNQQDNQIKNYVTIMERSNHTLQDLLKIWDDRSQSDQFIEYFQPEKLGYYFYQILCVVEYLHQRNVYYGDLKPQNILVFRDQRVKLGDFGISIKLDDDNDEDKKKYNLKGMTKAYTSVNMQIEYQNHKFQSKKDLFEADRFAVLKTFERCINSVSKFIKKGTESKQLYYKIYQDLKDSSITDTVEIWSECFANNKKLVNSIVEIMKNECKYQAYASVYQLTKYKNYIQNRLMEIYYKNFPSHVIEYKKVKDVNLPLDYLKIKRENKIYIQVDANFEKFTFKGTAAYERLLKDFEFKKIIVQILESWLLQFSMNHEDKDFSVFKQKIYTEFYKFYSFSTPNNSVIANERSITISEELFDEGIQYLEENEEQLRLYILFNALVNDEPEFWQNVDEQMKNVSIHPHLVSITDFKWGQIQMKLLEQEEQPEGEKLAYCLESLSSAYAEIAPKDKLLKIQTALQLCQLFLTMNDLQQAVNVINAEYEHCKKSLDLQYIEIAIQAAQIYRMAGQQEIAFEIAGQWLNRWAPLLGEGHNFILSFFGLIGELLLEQEEPDIQQAFAYLQKYSCKGLDALMRFKELVDEYSDLDDYEKYMEYIKRKQALYIREEQENN